jgi:GNAT acetyltransferase-like protein
VSLYIEPLAALPLGEPLQVEWVKGWDAALDDALDALPESPGCPHSLLRLLIQNEHPEPKQVAVVSGAAGEPIAVIPLRTIGETAEIATNWMVTGPPFPAVPGWHVPALRALGRAILVAWWPCDEDAFADSPVEDRMVIPTHRLDMSSDFEAHWRRTRALRTVRQLRKRCAGFRVEANAPGAAEWITRNWERRWRGEEASELPVLCDRLLVAEHLERLGRHHSLTLHDGDTLIGGLTTLVGGRGLFGLLSYRSPDYDRYGVGDRLFDVLFHWGADQGYEFVDIGGADYGEYKRRWAPEGGWKASFRVVPDPSLARRLARSTRRLLRRRADTQLTLSLPYV